ncbi:MAG: HD domain-containing protein [Ekhidna sp.]|uniref:HD domain-containing protein n=1 Tax=Ekhidna sp. TaxID=2608089 RepID=UPI0032EEA77D
MNKKKILNDPVYGFINIPNDLIFDIIEHRYFQRLRRIKQLGLTDLVYPGALHTRFHHALGAMDLMRRAINALQDKGVEISDKERQASMLAILLHDVGHGPFSHTLEFSLFQGVHHEQVGLWMMDRLNQEFDGALDLTIQIFKDKYHRPFFHQLVSSQLDIDRLDYLKRDSFFTGVYEGAIGSERIIKMLNVASEHLVVEEKGIYSIENFLSARRLMYWQVYLHKTAVSAEVMLIELIKRAKSLTQAGEKLMATPALKIFLERDITDQDFEEDPDILEIYALLDDADIWGSIKFWQDHEDVVLRKLSKMLLERKLLGISFSNEPTGRIVTDDLVHKVMKLYQIDEEEAGYFIKTGSVSNSAYIASGQSIKILRKHGNVVDVADASDLPNIKAMSKIVTKHYLCAPKELLTN